MKYSGSERVCPPAFSVPLFFSQLRKSLPSDRDEEPLCLGEERISREKLSVVENFSSFCTVKAGFDPKGNMDRGGFSVADRDCSRHSGTLGREYAGHAECFVE